MKSRLKVYVKGHTLRKGYYMKVYMDNAATTKTSKAAVEAMMPFFDKFYANPSSLHTPGQKAAEKLFEARAEVAACLGARPDEIYFTSCGSESDNQALHSAAFYGAKKNKKHIISTTVEHHAILHTLKKLESEGYEVTLLPTDEFGGVTAEQVEKAIRPDTCLVTVMYANNEIGTINPIREIGEVCRKHKVVFHTDAVQAVGHIPVNAELDNIDMLSLSAHKFHGPKGVGVLYVKKGVPLASFIEGGAQERGKRAGTENLAGIWGMTVALKNAVEHLPENMKKMERLRNRLIDGLSAIPHSILNGSREHRLPGNVNFIFEGIEGESMLLLLDEKGVCASSGSACTSGSLDPSHVLLAIGRPHEIAHGSLRLTLSEETTDEDVDYVLSVLPPIVQYLRNMSPLWRDKITGKKPFTI